MKRLGALLLALACLPGWARSPAAPVVVTIPYMEREASHRVYADKLLVLALELSRERYGPYRVVQQREETVIRRQLLELSRSDGRGQGLSVAVSMPTPEWMEGTLPVRVPIMRGLSSFRFFLGVDSQQPAYDAVRSLDDLKALTIGQGPGWSTVKLLQDHGFQIVIGGAHPTLIPMLHAGRFQLLMRSIFEVEPEWRAQLPAHPGLRVLDRFAIYTYMPMYFFVSRQQPELAERLTYGLQQAYANGRLDALFKQHFGDSLQLLKNKRLQVFRIPNTNIDPSFFERDRPYLLPEIVSLETRARR